jgi:hypothetical protein
MDTRDLAQMLVEGSAPLRALRGLMPQRSTVHAFLSLCDPVPLLTKAAHLTVRLRR